MILLLYVDDMFVTGMDGLIADTKRKLASKFEMKDMGMMHYFLSMKVWQNADGIFLEKGKYVVEILKRFGIMDCKAITTPMSSNLKLLSDASLEAVDATMYHQMIGSLMYLTDTRPDILFVVNTLRHVHLMFEKGTIEYGIKYDTNQKINLEGYVDSDWAVPSIRRTVQNVASVWDHV